MRIDKPSGPATVWADLNDDGASDLLFPDESGIRVVYGGTVPAP